MFSSIVKHAPKYFSASLISGGVTLLMTKYYTFVFTPDDFGILALYFILYQYIVTLVSLNMDSSATRFYFDYRERYRDEYLSTIFWFISILAGVVFIVGLSLKDIISNWIAEDTQLIYIVTLLAAIATVYVSFLMRVLYNEQKSLLVLKHVIFQTTINHLLSVFLISVGHLSVLGRMTGQGISYLTNALFLLKEFKQKQLFSLHFVFNKTMANETFMLALPSMIASFQTVAFIYLDRIFIKHYMGDSAVGIYTLGYILGQGLSMVYEAISQAMLPKVYDGLNKDYEKTRNELEYFSYRYYIGLVIITLTISLMSPWIVQLLSNETYQKAADVMPFVMAGFMMGGFYKIPSLLLGFHKVVWFYPLLSLCAFGINALLNWVLIPSYGIVGAGFASFLGVFIYSSVLQLFSMKFMYKRYNFFIFVIYSIILVTYVGVFYG